VMSMIRGFFQGYQSMGPTTVSQIIEQIVRIIFVLFGAWIVLYVMDGSIVQAVGMTTFGAFVGAVASFFVLLFYWKKRKHGLDKQLREQTVPQSKASTPTLMKELITYAIPFVFVGLAIPLYQLIDQYTFARGMSLAKTAVNVDAAYGVFANWTHSLIMIPVSLATAFSLTLVPTITESFTKRNFNDVRALVSQTFQLTFFVTAPAAIGMSLLGESVYNSLYTTNKLGGPIVTAYAPVGILFALFSVSMAVLQGLNLQKVAMRSLVFGVLTKLVFNIPFIMFFETQGAIAATALGYCISICYSFSHIMRVTESRYVLMFKRIFQTIVALLLMSVPVLLVEWGLSQWFHPLDSRKDAFIILVPSIFVGVITYLLVAKWFNLFEKILGKELLGKLTSRFTKKRRAHR
ncbi:MAG: putative polysaccharide biosynthesis protein, partial [Bacilli bacterium]